MDTSKWSFDTGTGAPSLSGWGNNELQYYTSRPANVRVEHGNLIMEAKKEKYNGSSFTSSKIKTKGNGDWTYGRFEILAKLPKGKGLWPAIWMLPSDNYYGGWPASGEIDIVEMLGHNTKKVYGTIHYGGEWPNNAHRGDSLTLLNGDFSDAFHLFALEWDAKSLRWYVDNTCFQTLQYGRPFDKNFHLILNVAVGGNWPGSPDSTTDFPARMEIEYVRIYQNAGPNSVKSHSMYRNSRSVNIFEHFDIIGRKIMGDSLKFFFR